MRLPGPGRRLTAPPRLSAARQFTGHRANEEISREMIRQRHAGARGNWPTASLLERRRPGSGGTRGRYLLVLCGLLTLPLHLPRGPLGAEEPPAGPDGAGKQPVDCNLLLDRIRTLEKGVPVIFRSMSRPVEEIYKDILECAEASTRYLESCRDGSGRAEVKSVLARMRLAGLARFQAELAQKNPAASRLGLDQLFTDHVQGLIKLAEEACAESPRGSPVWASAKRTLIDLLNRKLEVARVPELAEELLKEVPSYEHRPSVHLAVAQALLAARRYEQLVTYMKSVIKAHADDLEYVLYMDKLFEGLTGIGALEEMEELQERVIHEYTSKIPLIKEGSYFRNVYEQQQCIAPFWVGFCKMALGDNDGAKKTFYEHIASHGEWVKAREKAGRPPANDICTITVEYRTRDMIEVLEKFYGVKPREVFDLGASWVTKEHLDAAGAQGKVTVLVFRAPGDARAAPLLQDVNELVKSRGKDGLCAVTVAHLGGLPDTEGDSLARQKFLDDLEALNVSLPAGYDPDRKTYKAFREVHATVGTASVVVLNRKGEIAWFLADPRDMDRMVLRRVVERLLAESPAKTSTP